MSNKIELKELSKSQEFCALTAKQKLTIATYISNGYDIVHAIRTAYDCKNDNVAKIMSYRFFRNFNVAMTLSLHFGEAPLDSFLNQLARDIMKRKITHMQLEAYAMYADIKGWRGSAIVRAMAIAKELGLKAEAKTAKVALRGLKSKVQDAIENAGKTEPKDDGQTFDLSRFED